MKEICKNNIHDFDWDNSQVCPECGEKEADAHHKEIEKLKAENKKLKEALKFYSIEVDWDFYCDCCARGDTKLEMDHGKLARAVLKEIEGENE